MEKSRYENGNIVVYSEEQMKQKFNNYVDKDGIPSTMFYAQTKEVLESEGFFDFVLPPLSEGERYGEKYKDEDSNVFTCYVEKILPKSTEELQQEAVSSETQNYIQRTQDGANAYAKISAEFRLAKLSGAISEEAHAAIESTLIPVRNEVLAGQWISGLKILESIGSEMIGVDLYTRLSTQLNEYISSNYNS